MWQALVAFFQSFGETNTVLIVALVVVVVVAVFIYSEYADRRKYKSKKYSAGRRLRDRK
jgi:ABC-type Fe3+ transport system permease subunit